MPASLGGTHRGRGRSRRAVAPASGCAGWGGGRGGGGPNSINVLMVNNPQMVDLQKLTADNFTKETGINVNFTVLPENDVRDKISQEFSSQAGQYDVASLSNFEIPIYAKQRWIAPLDGYLAKDTAFDQADILKPMTTSLSRGRQDLRRAVLRRVLVPHVPQGRPRRRRASPCRPGRPGSRSATIAAKVDGAKPGMKGICLRGQPGWGQVFAPLTTVVNTFGGTWFDKDWNARSTRRRRSRPPPTSTSTWSAPTVRRAHRRPGSPSASTTSSRARRPCGTTRRRPPARWRRRTPRSRGKIGYAPAPVVQDQVLGLALRLVVEHPAGQPEEGQRLASSSRGRPARTTRTSSARRSAGPRVPAGKRASTYANPRLPQGGRGLRRADQTRDRHGRPEEPRRAAAAGDRHPVRRHPRVPGRRDPDLPV